MVVLFVNVQVFHVALLRNEQDCERHMEIESWKETAIILLTRESSLDYQTV